MKSSIYEIDNPIEKKWIFPIYIKTNEIIDALEKSWIECKSREIKRKLWNILHEYDSNEKIRNRCKNIFLKIYWTKENFIKSPNITKETKMLQTAFLEMEAFFSDKNRKQKSKNWFDHLMWTLKILLQNENVTINQVILTLLHDSIEDIMWYDKKHIEDVYGVNMANNVEQISKKDDWYYKKIAIEKWILAENENHKKNIKKAINRIKNEEYYWNMKNWNQDELIVKFADRLDSLMSMEWIQENHFLDKKLWETKNFFLIDELEKRVPKELFEKLKTKYHEFTNKNQKKEKELAEILS